LELRRKLAQQIENAAPFDVFAAAGNTEHIDELVHKGKTGFRRAGLFYARGASGPVDAQGASRSGQPPGAVYIAIGDADGRSLWQGGNPGTEKPQASGPRWRRRVVYANNINMAKAVRGFGQCRMRRFTAYSLVFNEKGLGSF